jgi:hypothetical protein
MTRCGHGAPEGESIGVLRTWTGIWCFELDTRGNDERSCGEEIAVHRMFKRQCHLTAASYFLLSFGATGSHVHIYSRADRFIRGGVRGNILLLLRDSSTPNIRKRGLSTIRN